MLGTNMLSFFLSPASGNDRLKEAGQKIHVIIFLLF